MQIQPRFALALPRPASTPFRAPSGSPDSFTASSSTPPSTGRLLRGLAGVGVASAVGYGLGSAASAGGFAGAVVGGLTGLVTGAIIATPLGNGKGAEGLLAPVGGAAVGLVGGAIVGAFGGNVATGMGTLVGLGAGLTCAKGAIFGQTN